MAGVIPAAGSNHTLVTQMLRRLQKQLMRSSKQLMWLGMTPITVRQSVRDSSSSSHLLKGKQKAFDATPCPIVEQLFWFGFCRVRASSGR